VHPDGIHFAGVRYLDLTLAAYVGEAITIRYDPRDLAEVRVYYQDRFLCRAVCPELASQTIGLKDLIHARRTRRRELQHLVAARINIADQLLPPPQATAQPEPVADAKPRLKRYFND
jgi:putative transposase